MKGKETTNLRESKEGKERGWREEMEEGKCCNDIVASYNVINHSQCDHFTHLNLLACLCVWASPWVVVVLYSMHTQAAFIFRSLPTEDGLLKS